MDERATHELVPLPTALSDADVEATALELLSLITDDDGYGDAAAVDGARLPPSPSPSPSSAFAPLELDDDAFLSPAGDAGNLKFFIPRAAVADAGAAADVHEAESGALVDSACVNERVVAHLDAAPASRGSRSVPAPKLEPHADFPHTATAAAFKAELQPLAPAADRPARQTPAILEAGARAKEEYPTRAKEELAYLREQVQVLERQLEALQKYPAAAIRDDDDLAVSASSSPSDESSSDAGSDTSSSAASMLTERDLWKRIAKHQLDEKQKAEVENHKLRQVLEGQLKIAQSLSKLLRKRPDVSWLETHQLGSRRCKKIRLEADNSEEDIFEAIAAQVNPLVGQLDAVFREAGLTGVQHELQDGVVKSDALGSLFLEFLDCKVVPFSVHVTAAALWKVLSQASMTVTNGVYQAVDVEGDTLRGQYSICMRLRRSEALANMRLVFRRIIEERRAIFVFRAEGYSEGSLLGSDRLCIRESGWAVIEEVVIPASGAEDSLQQQPPQRATSIMKTVMRMTPEVENSSSQSSHHHVGVFTDVALSGFHRNRAILHQNIENFILAELTAELLKR